MCKKLIYFLSFIILISCSKEINEINSETTDEEVESNQYFKLNKYQVLSSSSGGDFLINISTNSNWKVQSKPDWVTINPQSGNEDTELKIFLSPNTTKSPRIEYVEFISFENIFKLKITQESIKLSLLSYSGSETPIKMKEPKYLLFNKPITVNSITSGDERYSFYAGSDDVEYFDNNHGVRFTVGPSTLGTEHKYKISVSDSENNVMEEIIELKFYSEKLILPGVIKKMVMDDENNLWVLAINNRNEENSYLYKFRIQENRYIEDIKIPIGIKSPLGRQASGDFCINPYNNYLYVTDIYEKEIEIYSKNGALIKKISVSPNSESAPFGLGFTTSGKGMINIGFNWKYIDSANDDKITDPSSTNPYFYNRLRTFTSNHDKSKLYVIEDRSTIIKIFNGSETFEVISLHNLYPNVADAVRIIQNKLNDKIYVSGLYNQQIIDPDLSYLSYQTFLKWTVGDFCYDSNLTNHIYAIDYNSRFKLLDYGNQKTVFDYPISTAFNGSNRFGLNTSSDNNFIITYSDYLSNTDSSSQIVIYRTEMFE